MSNLIAASLVFLAIHFPISGTRLRDAITGAIGEGRIVQLARVSHTGQFLHGQFPRQHYRGEGISL